MVLGVKPMPGTNGTELYMEVYQRQLPGFDVVLALPACNSGEKLRERYTGPHGTIFATSLSL